MKLVAPLALALFALPAPAPAPERPSLVAERAFARALRSALDSAQAELQAGIVLAQQRTTWEQAWVVRSAHYEVRSLESWGLTKSLADGLEQMLPIFQRVLGTTWAPAEPFQVWVFPSLVDYNAFGETNGAEHSSFYGSFYSDQHAQKPVASYFCGDGPRLRQWITHSAYHQFVAGAFPGRAPPFVPDEALAAYFGLHWGYPTALQRFEYLKSSGSFIPLRELMRSTPQSFGPRSEDRLLELGMLTTYLLNLREDTRTRYDEAGNELEAPFASYLRTAFAGGDYEGMPIHQLVTADLDYLQDALLEHDFPR